MYSIYGSANATTQDKLRKKQKHAIRTICNDQLIKFSRILFMHYCHFAVSYHILSQIWANNQQGNPEIILCNVNELQISAHRVKLLKRLPFLAYTLAWNSAPDNKNNPKQHVYLKELEINCCPPLNSCSCLFYVPIPLPMKLCKNHL